MTLNTSVDNFHKLEQSVNNLQEFVKSRPEKFDSTQRFEKFTNQKICKEFEHLGTYLSVVEMWFR